MMKAVFWRALRDKRVAIISYCLAGIGLIWLYVAMYPSIQTSAETLNQLRKSIPPGLMKAFGIDDIAITSLASFLAVEQFSFTWPLIALFLMVSFASAQLAGAIEQRTIGLILSAPISRARTYWAKYLAGLVVLASFVLASIASSWPIGRAMHLDISLPHVLLTTLAGALFCWAVYGLAMACSSWFDEKSHVSVVMAGLLLYMYVAKLVAGLVKGWDWLKYTSFFYYFNPAAAIKYGSMTGVSTLVFMGAGVLGALVGLLVFVRRDVVV